MISDFFHEKILKKNRKNRIKKEYSNSVKERSNVNMGIYWKRQEWPNKTTNWTACVCAAIIRLLLMRQRPSLPITSAAIKTTVLCWPKCNHEQPIKMRDEN